MSEKIDGTNAQIVISDDGTELWTASRNRYITPEDDNYGFAKWVAANRDELIKLGPGRHYGAKKADQLASVLMMLTYGAIVSVKDEEDKPDETEVPPGTTIN